MTNFPDPFDEVLRAPDSHRKPLFNVLLGIAFFLIGYALLTKTLYWWWPFAPAILCVLVAFLRYPSKHQMKHVLVARDGVRLGDRYLPYDAIKEFRRVEVDLVLTLSTGERVTVCSLPERRSDGSCAMRTVMNTITMMKMARARLAERGHNAFVESLLPLTNEERDKRLRAPTDAFRGGSPLTAVRSAVLDASIDPGLRAFLIRWLGSNLKTVDRFELLKCTAHPDVRDALTESLSSHIEGVAKVRIETGAEEEELEEELPGEGTEERQA